jgi:restriction endonuclease Mrr
LERLKDIHNHLFLRESVTAKTVTELSTKKGINMDKLATAILKIIYDNGPKVMTSQIYNAIEKGDYYRLQDHHLEKTVYGGRPAYQHEVRSYLSNMVKDGLAERLVRGVYGITESGKKAIGNKY